MSGSGAKRASGGDDGGGAAEEEAGWRERWSDHLALLCAAGLSLVWLVIVCWALRLGEPTKLSWAITSIIPWLPFAAWPVFFVALAMRRRGLALAAAVTVVAQVFIAWPMVPRAEAAGQGLSVTIDSINGFVSNPDPVAAGGRIAARRADILVVQELTPDLAGALHRYGVLERLPHHLERPDTGTVGLAVYSRFPIEEVALSGSAVPVLAVAVELPGSRTLRVVNTHLFPPQPDDEGIWIRELHRLDQALDSMPEPWVAIGDYNATGSHRGYRDLLHGGRRDAHEVTGRPYARTWPANGPLLPPLILIDRALMSPGLGARSTGEHTVPGSDHRMIRVTLAVP